jgi:hypothetical protein
LAREDIASIEGGVFFLFRPDWVYGDFQMRPISAGHNRGKFFVQPRVNFSPITAYFSGEHVVNGKRKLGTGTISCHRDWLELPAKVVRETPADVELWFKRIVVHVSSGIVVKAGVHRYEICRGVIADPTAPDCLPPFDFIPWNSEILRGPVRRRKVKSL